MLDRIFTLSRRACVAAVSSDSASLQAQFRALSPGMAVVDDGKSRSILGVRTSSLAPVMAALSCILFCLNSELLQWLQNSAPKEELRPSPGVNLLLCHLGGLVFAPSFLMSKAFDVPMAARGDERSWSVALSEKPRLMALFFALLLMGYNYCWLWSAKLVKASITTALFQTSVGMVYVISVPVFGESLSFPRVMGIGLLVLGSMMASGVTTEQSHNSVNHAADLFGGVALALMAAVGVTLYQVVFRHMFGRWKHDLSFLAFFGSWVSLWHLLVILPLLCLANITGFESLDFPRGQHTVAGVFLSACIASAVNMLFFCIALCGSVMLLPCANTFAVPCTVFLDMVLHNVRPSRVEFFGDALVVVGIILVMDLAVYWISVGRGPAYNKFPKLEV